MSMIDDNRYLIESALRYSGGTHSFDDVKAAILDGTMQIWPAPRGVAVTEIIVYPRAKSLHVFLAAGEMDQLLDMIDAAMHWGRSQGCTAMSMTGRFGWQKVLAKHGWKPKHITLERSLADG